MDFLNSTASCSSHLTCERCDAADVLVRPAYPVAFLVKLSRDGKVAAVIKRAPTSLGKGFGVSDRFLFGIALIRAMNFKLVDCKVPKKPLNYDPSVLAVFQAFRFGDDRSLTFGSHLRAHLRRSAILL